MPVAHGGVPRKPMGMFTGIVEFLGEVESLRVTTEGGGLTLHVRLIGGDDPEHVLESIFKALGVALAQSFRPRGRG